MCPAAEVPALVRRYLDRALPAGGSTPRQVRVRQPPDDRALVKRLVDGEVRRRHQYEAERTAKIKRSYLVAKAP